MSDRSIKPLSHLLAHVAERTSARKDASKPYVGLEHIPSGGSLLATVGTAQDSTSTNSVFARGDVLFGKLRPRLRKSVRAKLAGYCSTDILVLRPTENVDPDFAGFVAQSDTVFSAAIRTEEGTKMPRCSWKDLRNVEVFCPQDKKAQARIASVLLAVNSAIEKTETLIAKHQQIKAGLMQDLFTRGVLPNGQLRPAREQAPNMYTQSVIGWVPNEWDVSGLAGKGRAGVKWIRTGPFGSALKGEHWVTQGRPVITIGALGEGEFLESDLLFVGPKDAVRLVDFQLQVGDVVFSRVADVGRSVVIRDEHAGWIMSSNLMRIAVDERMVLPDYLQMLLAADARIKAQIKAKVNSGGRDVANSEVLSQLRFPWPPKPEQDRIVTLADRATQRARALKAQLAKLHLKRLGLMQDLLTGKVPVKVDRHIAEPADA